MLQTKPAIYCRVLRWRKGFLNIFWFYWAKIFVKIRVVWGLLCWQFCLYNSLNFFTGWLGIFCTLTVGNKPVPSLRQVQSCGSGVIYSGSGFCLSNHSGSGSGSYLSNHSGSDQAAKFQISKSVTPNRIRILPFKSFRITDPSGSDQARKFRIQIHIIRDSTYRTVSMFRNTVVASCRLVQSHGPLNVLYNPCI